MPPGTPRRTWKPSPGTLPSTAACWNELHAPGTQEKGRLGGNLFTEPPLLGEEDGKPMARRASASEHFSCWWQLVCPGRRLRGENRDDRSPAVEFDGRSRRSFAT